MINNIHSNIDQIISGHIITIDTVGDDIMIIVIDMIVIIDMIMIGVFGAMTTGNCSIDALLEKIARFIKNR